MESDDTVTLTRSPAASPASPAAGQVVIPRELGHVRLLRELGRGAMGVVWLGHDTLLDRRVAVKFLLNAASGPEDPGFERFLQGARAAARVRHPALAGLHHAEVVNNVPYLVMEFVDGVPLSDVLATTGPLSPSATAAVLQSVGGAVGELHEQKIVHRDLKPANILLDGSGRVFVTDFGLACGRTPPGAIAHGGGGSGSGSGSGSVGSAPSAVVAGTPAYMAPEAFEGAITPRSDVYALGVMTFQLLTGKLPFTADSWKAVRDQHRDRPLPLEALREHGVADGWVEVIERAAHKNALFRYKSAQAFWRAVEVAAGPGGVPRRPDAELTVLLAHHRAAGGAAPAPGAGVTLLAAPSDRPAANTYPEMISQLAEAKRKVKPVRPVGLDLGSDFVPPAGADAGPDVPFAVRPAEPLGAEPLAAAPFAAPHPDPVAAPAPASPLPVAPLTPAPVSPRADVVVLERKPAPPTPAPAAVTVAATDWPAPAPAARPAAEAPEGGRRLNPAAVGLVLITVSVCGSSIVLAGLLRGGWPAAVGIASLAAMACWFGYLLARGK